MSRLRHVSVLIHCGLLAYAGGLDGDLVSFPRRDLVQMHRAGGGLHMIGHAGLDPRRELLQSWAD